MLSKKIIVILAIIAMFLGIVYYVTSKGDEEIIEYTPQEEISDEMILPQKTIVNLFFINKEKTELISEIRAIESIKLVNQPYTELINLLLDGPKVEGNISLIPVETKLNSVEVKNGIVFVDFSKEFTENYMGKDSEEILTINTIVNTLTELNEINGVKILIDGEENMAFKDNFVNFTNAFTKTY